MDINSVIFSNVSNTEKKNAVENASASDLMRISESTLKRMVKERGSDNYYKDRKILFFGNVSNNWNADAKSLELYKDKLFINFYVQYSNTDTDDCEYMSKFLGSGEFRGAIKYTDMYDNPHTSYYRFDSSDKAKVMRAICLAYIKECEKK